VVAVWAFMLLQTKNSKSITATGFRLILIKYNMG